MLFRSGQKHCRGSAGPAERAPETWPEGAPDCHLPLRSRRHLCGPAGVLQVGGRGDGPHSHDARRGEDRAHAQGVCDLPATGQRLARALGVLVLFCRQQLPSQGFPASERGSLEAASTGPAGQELLMAAALEDLAPLGPQNPGAGEGEGLLPLLPPPTPDSSSSSPPIFSSSHLKTQDMELNWIG